MHKTIKILVVSDIHFGSSSVSKDFSIIPPKHEVENAVSMKDNLCEIISKEKIDAIFICGDLTSTATPAEFIGCQEVIYEIANAAKIDKKNIFFTFGNHDVNWKISKICEDDECDIGYQKVAASIGNIFIKNKSIKNEGIIIGSGKHERDNFDVYVLNSSFYSYHDQKYYHGKIGKKQFSWLKENIKSDNKKWNFCLMHHHPFNYSYPNPTQDISCIEEGSDLIDLLGVNGIDLICHGHRHHPKLFTQQTSGWHSPVTFFCAGSLSVEEKERTRGEIPNVFHIINFEEKDSGNNAAKGFVKSYEYHTSQGWIPLDNKSCKPLNHITYFGSILGEKEQKEKINTYINNLIKSKDDFIEIPPYKELPFDIKCISIELLNQYIKEFANKNFYRVFGDYNYSSDGIMFKRKNNAKNK